MTRSLTQFVRHTGIAAPFLQPDLEGEFIAPVGPDLEDLHHLSVHSGGVVLEAHTHDGSWTGQHAFPGFRYRRDGSEDPSFILNQEPYRNASILLAGRSFGRGSLQAYAAIRLRQCGMRAIIAPSFGPVFHDDCFDYGLLPVNLGEEVVAWMADQVRANPEVAMTVDLVSQVVERAGMGRVPFQVDPRRRMSLLTGSDTTLDERLQHGDGAAAARSSDRSARPWIYDTRRNGGP
jgi:3-isopropylmalate/(R)-2-methylmalate dehydratase small subunit